MHECAQKLVVDQRNKLAEASQVSQHASYNRILGFINYETQFLKTCCLIGVKIYKRQEV